MGVPKNFTQVSTLINYYIDVAYRPTATVSENLDAAQVAAMNARKGPHDLNGRDAEYYLKARWLVSERGSVAAKVPVAVGGQFLTARYQREQAARVVVRAGTELPHRPGHSDDAPWR